MTLIQVANISPNCPSYFTYLLVFMPCKSDDGGDDGGDDDDGDGDDDGDFHAVRFIHHLSYCFWARSHSQESFPLISGFKTLQSGFLLTFLVYFCNVHFRFFVTSPAALSLWILSCVIGYLSLCEFKP